MPAKRKFGELSKLPSGKYRARYTHEGTRWSAPKAFYTHDAAAEWLLEQRRLIELGIWQPPVKQATQKEATQTVGQWLKKWLDLSTPTWKPSTLQSHQAVIERRILTTTGDAAQLRDIPLSHLTRKDIAFWWDALTMQYGAQPYNYSAYKRLRTALGAAVSRDLIPANPASGLKISRPAPTRKELPSTEDMQAILEEMEGRYKIICILTFFHGMRIGEVLALRRKDIEDQGNKIIVHIRGTAYRKVGIGMVRLNSPKTSAGLRSVPLFTKFNDDIRTHLQQWVGTSPDAFLCTTGTGEIVMDTSYRSVLNRAKKRAGVDTNITPHYGRVWLITTLIEAGMTIPAIGDILGQRDLKTITEIYMRTSEERKQEVLNTVNDML